MVVATTLAFLLTTTFFGMFFLTRLVSWVVMQQRITKKDLRDTITTLTMADVLDDRDKTSKFIDVLLGHVCVGKEKAPITVFAVVKSLVAMLQNVYLIRYAVNSTHQDLTVEAVPRYFRQFVMNLLVEASEAVLRADHNSVTVLLEEDAITFMNKATLRDREKVQRIRSRLTVVKEVLDPNWDRGKVPTAYLCQLLGWQMQRSVEGTTVITRIVWSTPKQP